MKWFYYICYRLAYIFDGTVFDHQRAALVVGITIGATLFFFSASINPIIGNIIFPVIMILSVILFPKKKYEEYKVKYKNEPSNKHIVRGWLILVFFVSNILFVIYIICARLVSEGKIQWI